MSSFTANNPTALFRENIPASRTQRVTAIAFALLVAAIAAPASAHNAYILVGGDPVGSPFFSGTFRPSSPNGISTINGVAGYLNGVSGGAFGGGTGEVLIGSVGPGDTLLVGFAIHLADTAGPSHSLSSLNDPAIADIVSDLNHPSSAGPIRVNAYAYGNAPAQYADALSILSAGEAANGGQPFDVLITAKDPGFNKVWATDFFWEIGYLDGITALTITDIGAVPEPTGIAVLGVLAAPALLARRRRK